MLSLVAVAVGCGDNTPAPGDASADLSGSVDAGADLTGGGDMAGLKCSMTDPMTDNADCSTNFSCTTGQLCVRDTPTSTTYHCKLRCDSGNQVVPALCPCDRACVPLTDADGGVVGAGCIPGLTAGIHCTGNPPCAQNTFCAGPAGGSAYCLWNCTGPADCPSATTCSQIKDQGGNPIGLACTYNYGSAGKPGGTACTSLNDTCMAGFLCDGTKCQTQCNGPSDTTTCASPTTCQALNDPAQSKIIGYVCK